MDHTGARLIGKSLQMRIRRLDFDLDVFHRDLGKQLHQWQLAFSWIEPASAHLGVNRQALQSGASQSRQDYPRIHRRRPLGRHAGRGRRCFFLSRHVAERDGLQPDLDSERLGVLSVGWRPCVVEVPWLGT